jgi:4-hydroxy-tetrahydrodipicolinate synthase
VKTLYPLSGIVPIVNTPFDEHDRIDVEALERAVDDRLAAGAAGVIVPAVASEVGRLTAAERRQMVEVVARRAAGRVPVIAGASAAELAETRATCEWALRHGCAGVLVQPPVSLFRDEPGLRAYLAAVAETGVPMLMVQDLEWNGPGIPVETIRVLFDGVEPFRCIKIEVVPAGPKYTSVLEATGGRLNVSGGWASTQFVEALDRGVHGFMPSAHYWVFAEILRRYRAGDQPGAVGLFERLLPILAFTSQHIDVSIQFQKLLAVRQGIFRTARVRPPHVSFDAYHARIAADLLDRAVALHEEVGWRPAAAPLR